VRVLGGTSKIHLYAEFQILLVQAELLHHAGDVEEVLSDSVVATFVSSGGDGLLVG
jgi:hypothetical protein